MEKSEKNKHREHIPEVPLFIICGLSGMGATLFVQPLDMIKNRMQLSGEGGRLRDYTNSINAIGSIVRKEGFRELYSGLSVNLFRQITYTPMRMTIFQMTLDHMHHSGFFSQVVAGLVGGFFAGIFGAPADRAFVRMTSNGKLPQNERRNYKNLSDALSRIATEERRPKSFLVMIEPKVLGAMVTNVSQLVSYTEAKCFLIENGYMEDNVKCHFTSSLISSFVYTLAACPFDVAKTRIHHMKTGLELPMYSGVLDVFTKTVRNEGVSALWKGAGPLFIRIAPQTILLFLFIEKLTLLYKEYFIPTLN